MSQSAPTVLKSFTGWSPRIETELEALIIRLAKENSWMGYGKIQGELLKLGYSVDEITIRNVLRRHRVPPAPQRGKSSWRSFLTHYQQQLLCAGRKPHPLEILAGT